MCGFLIDIQNRKRYPERYLEAYTYSHTYKTKLTNEKQVSKEEEK